LDQLPPDTLASDAATFKQLMDCADLQNGSDYQIP
jgi:hypothetical protein